MIGIILGAISIIGGTALLTILDQAAATDFRRLSHFTALGIGTIAITVPPLVFTIGVTGTLAVSSVITFAAAATSLAGIGFLILDTRARARHSRSSR